MKRTRSVLAPAALLFAALAACGGSVQSPGGGAADSGPSGGAELLAGRDFVSTSITETGAPRPLVDGTAVSLRFTADGRVIADAGCNMLQSAVRLTGGRLGVSDLSMTEMGCDPQRHEQDTWLATFLGKAPQVALDDSTLTLTAGDTSMVLTDREVAEPDVALDGTWTVDTLVSGQTASSVPAGATATIRFAGDRAEVNTGCNTGTVVFKVDGATLVFGELGLTRKACEPNLMQLEQAVVAALTGTVAFEIDADRLTLEHPSGAGLGLTTTG